MLQNAVEILTGFFRCDVVISLRKLPAFGWT